IKDSTPTRAVDPEIENQVFVVGRGDEVTISPLDDDQKHAQVHAQFLQSPEGQALPDFTKNQLVQHIQRHAASFVMKQQMAQAQAAQQAQQAIQQAQGQPQQPQGGRPGQGQPGPQAPGGPVTPSRNVMPEPPGRPPQTTNEGDLQRRLPRTPMQ